MPAMNRTVEARGTQSKIAKPEKDLCVLSVSVVYKSILVDVELQQLILRENDAISLSFQNTRLKKQNTFVFCASTS